MLRVALPNKGALSDIASTMFKEAGYLQRRDSRELAWWNGANQVDSSYLVPAASPFNAARAFLIVAFPGRDRNRNPEFATNVEK